MSEKLNVEVPFVSERKKREISRVALHALFESEMQEVDERLISREEALELLHDYVDFPESA